jgi:hypothetical protein
MIHDIHLHERYLKYFNLMIPLSFWPKSSLSFCPIHLVGLNMIRASELDGCNGAKREDWWNTKAFPNYTVSSTHLCLRWDELVPRSSWWIWTNKQVKPKFYFIQSNNEIAQPWNINNFVFIKFKWPAIA